MLIVLLLNGSLCVSKIIEPLEDPTVLQRGFDFPLAGDECRAKPLGTNEESRENETGFRPREDWSLSDLPESIA